MRVFQAIFAASIIASALSTGIISPHNLQIATASAELLAPAPAHIPPALQQTALQQTAWQQTAWQHWGTTGLDPQHAPYSVVFVGDTLQNLVEDEISHALQASITTWNNVTCAIQQLRFAGFRPSLNAVLDHEIPIFIPDAHYWHNQPNLIAATHMNSPAIALNTTHFTWSLEPAPFQYFPPNSSNTSTQAPLIVDLQSVLTHELGHILGIWHTEDDATATMGARYLPDANQRSLAADDKFALCHLYPKPGTHPECTHNNDCPHGPCVTDGSFHVCQKLQANPGEFCALDLLHCPHGCIIDSPATGTGYCTSPCQNHIDCPTHFECTRHDNQDLCLLIRPESPDSPQKIASCSTTAQHAMPHAALSSILTLLAFGLFTQNMRRRKNP